MRNARLLLVCASLILAILCGCSSRSDNSPSEPSINPTDELPVTMLSKNSDGHEILGFFQLDFDLESMQCTVTPDREMATHYNLSSMVTPSIQIISYSPSTGILDVNATIRNPYSINGYDLRLIIFTDSIGHFLQNWDDFTDLYDIAGGNIINPFKAYAKSEPNRRFAGLAQHTENLKIYCPGGNFTIRTAVDASFPSNCAEPYSIDNFAQDTLSESAGASAQISIDVSDWQNNASSVYLYCPIITGGPLVPFTKQSATRWTGTLTNVNGIGVGQYTGYIVAYSGSAALYDLVVIQVSKSQPQFDSVLTYGGASWDTMYGSATDSLSNLYHTGVFYETVDFDPGPGVVQRSSLGQGDAFLLKLNEAREFQWVQIIANTTDIYGKYILIDRNQYIYLIGMFNGSCDFDPGPGVDLHTSAGFYDIFVVKYDLSGNWIWAKTYGGGSFDQIHSLVCDLEGNIYISGYFSGTVDFDPGPGSYEVSCKGYQDNYVLKLDSDGNMQWVDVFGSTLGETPYNIYLKDNSSLVVAGWFEGTIDFDPSPGIQNRTPSGASALYILNLDLNGNYINVEVFGGDLTGSILKMSQHPTYGYVISGYFSGYMDFDPSPGEDIRTAEGDYSSFICTYDSALNYQWVQTFGSPSGFIYPSDILFTSDGGTIAGGSYWGTIDADPGSGEYWLNPTAAYISDAYISKLDASGNFEWISTWGGSDSDSVNEIKYMPDGTIYAMGHFVGTVDFDPGPGVIEKTSNGNADVYISIFK